MQKCLMCKQIFVISVWQNHLIMGVFWIINGASVHMHLLKVSVSAAAVHLLEEEPTFFFSLLTLKFLQDFGYKIRQMGLR